MTTSTTIINDFVSTFDSINAEIKEKEQELAKLRSQASQDFKERLMGMLKEFFEKNTEITQVSWIQWGEYYNDDSRFSHIGELHVALSNQEDEVEEDEDDEDDEEGLELYSLKDKISPELHTELDALETFIQNQEDIMERTFGDCVKVVVTKDGIEVEEGDYCDY